MAKERRRLSLVAPSSPSDDSAYLGWAYSVFLGQGNASPSAELRSPQANFIHLVCRQFCCAALFAVLHGAMFAHVHLVIRMSGPAQIILAVVSGVTVSVRYIRQLFWVRYERQSNQPVHRPGMAFSAAGQIQYDGFIAVTHSPQRQQMPRLEAILTPVDWNPVTAYLAFLRNFVVRKTFNLFPHGGIQ